MTLINSVIHSMANYALNASFIANGVLETIEKQSRTFFCDLRGGKRGTHMINWPTLQLSKSSGGLGIKNLKIIRPALIVKQIFALLNQHSSPWTRFFLSKYVSCILRSQINLIQTLHRTGSSLPLPYRNPG